ncbi:MAG TPA: hypothetical protein VLB50_03190 [Ignavibacteriaceae bacterium]|nr:hypothetical protein [Ignavibacteriaceae bacterium]
MKKFYYILSLLTVSGILFTGCYTQVATRDRDYTDNNTQPDYNNDQGYSGQYGDTSYYDDSTEYYGDNYSDSTESYDRGYNSPYYYDNFYYNYPIYHRYFWGYHPSIVIGFGWNSWYYNPWYYDPFYCYWDSWYYPGSWSCLPYYYYYPSPYFYGYNYYYGYGYPYFSNYYYTNRERTRDITRIRNLDGLRGGSRDRNSITRNNTGGIGKERTSRDPMISTRTGNTSPRVGSNETGRTTDRTRIGNERTGNNRSPQIGKRNTRNSGRINPYIKRNQGPSVEKKNDGRRIDRYYVPRNQHPDRKGYAPRKDSRSGYYIPPKRNTSREYSPSGRNSSPKSYSPPQRSYSPPQKSYTPPSGNNGGGRSSGNYNGGSRSSGGSNGRSSGRR